MLKKILLFSTVLALIFVAYQLYQTGSDNRKQTSADKIVIADQSEQPLFDLIHHNLIAINQKKIDDYLTTLVPTARKDSQKEIRAFLDSYTVKISLDGFRVLKKDKTHCLVETKQKTTSIQFHLSLIRLRLKSM